MTPARFRWGLMFISIGTAILLTNADVIGYDYWMELFSLWPIILIAIGVEKVFSKGNLKFISYLAPFLMVGTMVYVGFVTDSGWCDEGTYTSSRWSETIDESVVLLDAQIDHYSNDLRIGNSYSDMVKARFDRYSRRPKIEYFESDSIAKLDIKHRRGGPGRIIVFNRHRFDRDWQLSFNGTTPLNLTCLGDASNVDLNLKSVPIQELTVDNDEGDISLEIGKLVSEVDANIKGDDVSFRLRAPKGCGLRFDISEANYIDFLEPLNLTKIENYYISENYDSSEVKIKLTFDDLVRRISVSYY